MDFVQTNSGSFGLSLYHRKVDKKWFTAGANSDRGDNRTMVLNKISDVSPE